MGGGEGDAQAGGVSRHGGVTDGGDKDILFAQFSGGVHGGFFVAENQRDDGAGGLGIQSVYELEEVGATLFTFGGLDDLNTLRL